LASLILERRKGRGGLERELRKVCYQQGQTTVRDLEKEGPEYKIKKRGTGERQGFKWYLKKRDQGVS